MDTAERQAKRAELKKLRRRVIELERELETAPPHWQATNFYTAYYATTGFMLGAFGAFTSLLFNVVGSALVEQHPLRLIQIYLTFPLAERALELEGGLALAIGCCLYISTGMLLGAPFQVLMARTVGNGSIYQRVAMATILATSMWVIHFYAILSWLQPLLFGGRWIVELIPVWIGLLTHLVYGWTMAVVFPLGRYVPYRRQTEHA